MRSPIFKDWDQVRKANKELGRGKKGGRWDRTHDAAGLKLKRNFGGRERGERIQKFNLYV